jgi:phosphoribosylanthranilate isomerase
MTTPERTRIKICGLTREADVDAAVQAGADAVGFVMYERSPRYVSAARAAQLVRLVKFAADYSNAQAILLDAHVDGYGGGGKTFNWSLLPPSVNCSPRFVWWTHACKRDRWHFASTAALHFAGR